MDYSVLPLTPAPNNKKIVKRLYLCRHGETEANANGILQGSGVDDPLNERGIQQAQSLKDAMKQCPIELVVSSTLKRAKQTAEIIAEHHHVPSLEIDDLAEISWGSWDGTVTNEVQGLLKSWERGDFEASSPCGESPLHVVKRSVPVIYSLLNRPERNFLFVLHGRLLRIILSSLLHKSLEKMSIFTHHNACINIIDVIIDTEQDVQNASPTLVNSLSSVISMPQHIEFIPIVLDSREHLSMELRNS